MSTATEQTLTIRDLYAMRDNIGLPKQECIAPVKKRSWFEWDKFEQAYYIKKIAQGNAEPPRIFIYEPLNSPDKAVILDGRQRLKAIFSYLDGNLTTGAAGYVSCEATKIYNQVISELPSISSFLPLSLQVSIVNASSYWMAALSFYPLICGHGDYASNELEMFNRVVDENSPVLSNLSDCKKRLGQAEGEKHQLLSFFNPKRRRNKDEWRRELDARSAEVHVFSFIKRHLLRGVIPC